MSSEPEKHRRRSIRLKEYDYSQPGAYFVTICTQGRECLFGSVVEGEMRLGEFGEIAYTCWEEITGHFPYVKLDIFVIMPNHVHGVIVIVDKVRGVGAQHAAPLPDERYQLTPGSLGVVIRSYKSAVSKRVNELRKTLGESLWQRNYYEHIIRNEKELRLVREYIVNNPLQWALDRENPIKKGTHVTLDNPWLF